MWCLRDYRTAKAQHFGTGLSTKIKERDLRSASWVMNRSRDEDSSFAIDGNGSAIVRDRGGD